MHTCTEFQRDFRVASAGGTAYNLSRLPAGCKIPRKEIYIKKKNSFLWHAQLLPHQMNSVCVKVFQGENTT